MQTELLETNNLHSPVTEEFLNVLDKRSRTDFFHYISEVEFIQNLLDPKRAKARNLPKDRKGRIIVDVTKPHILENMDFFTERADYFRKYGRYTDIYPNPAPGSEYRKFWDEERRRCREGLVRPSDGEWIPGYYYFYLNYSPILIVEEIEKYEEGELNKDAKGDINRIVGDYLDNEELEGIQAERVEDFPSVYDGDYLFFHYVDQAMRQGKHGSVLKTRGRGYSFKGGGMMARNYFLHRASKSYAFASETEYLTRDGILSKAWSNINFIDSNTPFTQPRDYKDTEMHKRASYKDTTHKTERGFMAEVIGVTCKNEPDKGRGKRGKLLFFDECFGKDTEVLMYDFSTKKIQNIQKGDLVMGERGEPRMVAETHSGLNQMYKIKRKKGDDLIVSKNHKLVLRLKIASAKHLNGEYIMSAEEYLNKPKWFKQHSFLFKSGSIERPENLMEIPAYMLGHWLGDGDSSRPTVVINTEKDGEILQYYEDLAIKYDINIRKTQHTASSTCKNVTLYKYYKAPKVEGRNPSNYKKNEIADLFRNYNLINNKHIPKEYIITDIQHRLELLAGLIDADGYLSPEKNSYEVIMKDNDLADQVALLARSCGLTVTIKKKDSKTPQGNIKTYNRLAISGNTWKIPCKVSRKIVQEHPKYINFGHSNFSLEPIGVAEYYGFSLQANRDEDRKFLLKDFTVVRNSGIFPGLKKTWGIARKSVEQGRYTYGFMVTAGTGGTEGADFEAAEGFFYSPGAYNILAVKNVFDESKGHSECAFFAPEYLNREGCFDKNGNSDVTKALVEILYSWQKVRNSSSDPNDLVHEKAEAPITPQHAVLRIEGSIFPTQDLKDYLSEIAPHMSRFVSSHYTGRLKVSGDGVVDFVYQEDKTPIRDYPIKDNLNKEGCIEIFEPPQRLSTGYVPKYRYIAGIDTYDDDHSTTNSLGSILILDRLTDRIVAEYTGRPTTANEFYEICLRLLKYYNAIANYENDKKGLYGYFFNKNQLHYLCDNPEILADKNLAKIQNNYGNKKKGTNSGVAINAWGRRLQADWLVSNAYGTGGEDEEGNEIPPLMNLQKLRSIGYIKELIQWHPDINADRVSAAGMLFILRADMERMDTEGTTETSSIAKDDPFFKRTGNPYGNVSAF